MDSHLKEEFTICFESYWVSPIPTGRVLMVTLQHFFFFFYQGFLHRHWRFHRTAGEGRGPSFIPFYHFPSFTNIQTFIATFHVRWLSHIFNRTARIYQTAIRWGLPPYRITIWLIDDAMLVFVCVLDDLIQGFCYSNWHGKTVDSNSHRLSSLYYTRTD